MISPSATSPALSTIEDDGLFFPDGGGVPGRARLVRVVKTPSRAAAGDELSGSRGWPPGGPGRLRGPAGRARR